MIEASCACELLPGGSALSEGLTERLQMQRRGHSERTRAFCWAFPGRPSRLFCQCVANASDTNLTSWFWRFTPVLVKIDESWARAVLRDTPGPRRCGKCQAVDEVRNQFRLSRRNLNTFNQA